MQRLSFIINTTLLFLLAGFAFEPVFLKTVVFSYVLIVLFISAYLFELKFAFFLFVFASLLLSALSFFGLEILYVPVLIFCFAAIIQISYLSRENFRLSLIEFKDNLDTLNQKYTELKSHDLRTLQGNKKLENTVSEIEDIYEITKEMSVSLEFEKIFKIFEAAVRKKFRFDECSLIYVEKKEDHFDENGKALKIYETFSKGDIQLKNSDKALFRYFSNNNGPLILKEDSNVVLKKEFDLLINMKTFIAAPLVIERELMGVLSMVNLPEENFEKFVILAGQFALEVKKTVLYKRVEELALTDGLTRLFVRRHFLERLGEELERSTRHKLPLALLMIDIDFFKKCNDTYGHLSGDVVLKEIAFIIKSSVREVDLAGRYGGEEFCVALPETDRKGAEYVAERIRAAIEEKKIKAYDEIIQTKVSIGISLFPQDKKDPLQLLEAADSALYKAKKTGRNRFCLYGKK